MTTEEKDKYWLNGAEKYKKILLGAKSYFDSIPDRMKAFELKDRCLRCMDEGAPGGIHLAGSGILMNLAEAERIVKEARIEGIYSHEECGAAGIYAKKENLDPASADEYGEEWAKTLAERLNLPYLGHINIGEMRRPVGLHIATVAYYDNTGEFDYALVSALPPGFVISRKYLSAEYAKMELATAASIALGHHGFGDKFTAKSPFIIVILVKKDDPIKPELLTEANDVAREYGDRVKVDCIEV